MPKKGPAYPISDEWRSQVRTAIDAMIGDPNRDEITSDAKFAQSAGISKALSKASLSEALNPASTQSTVMPQINAALAWPAPRVLSTPDELEMWAAVKMLSERDLGRILGMAEGVLARLRKRV